MSPSILTPVSSTAGSSNRLGFWAAIVTVAIAAAFAVMAIPTPARSGPFCVTGCVAYPYVDVKPL